MHSGKYNIFVHVRVCGENENENG